MKLKLGAPRLASQAVLLRRQAQNVKRTLAPRAMVKTYWIINDKGPTPVPGVVEDVMWRRG